MYSPSHLYYGYAFRPAQPPVWSASAVALNQKLRALWEQHVYWTRMAVSSIIGRLPDETATVARLLRNPSDFGKVLEPLYGTAIANRFASLLGEHLTIAAELIKALQAGNDRAAEDANTRWFRNADDIAELLGRINPYWSVTEWRQMLYEHLRLLSSAVQARLAGNYAENVALSDRIEPQALMMADMMTKGIVRQFPAAFH